MTVLIPNSGPHLSQIGNGSGGHTNHVTVLESIIYADLSGSTLVDSKNPIPQEDHSDKGRAMSKSIRRPSRPSEATEQPSAVRKLGSELATAVQSAQDRIR